MEREILVFGAKNFKIKVPDGCRITFGPWSPPTGESKYSSEKSLVGTLRVYQGPSKTTEDVIAVFSNVTGFRDVSLDFQEEVAREEGAIIWKSDKTGYSREEKVKRETEWTSPQLGTVVESDDESL